MGMILLPACIVLVILVITVIGLLKKGGGGAFLERYALLSLEWSCSFILFCLSIVAVTNK
ncbi:hypothetical protein [Enterobacter asburiae]|uniref:hypothetical protein n=1 Tax=Enterobacter asburiae TaxID=61645 RepID=UPI00192CE150|nr:hypothetical protein [Enterobacter asburiae]MBL5836800.1 hypothetical protein [Enterobacter asburiae]MBL5937359.1 hypothetical protein [Enterobacter asburiae]MBL5962269.1 hypothetical protein [Enterobacter asburiae]